LYASQKGEPVTVVRPFRGLRPQPELAAEVAAPPYDVLSSDEAREMARNNPNLFLRVNKPEINFSPEASRYSKEIYERGKAELDRMVRDGVMVQDKRPSFYLYRLTMQGKSQTGLVALTSCEEYVAGKIKKHEHTRPEKVTDRADHIAILEAQVGPVFSTFKYDPKIDAIFTQIVSGPALIDFTADDNVQHEIWVVSDESSVSGIVEAFASHEAVYIADGHHRSEAGAEICGRYREQNPNHTGQEIYNFFLNVLFADRDLHILPYNRVVRDLNGLSPEQLIERVGENFDVVRSDGPVTPESPHQFGMYAGGNWYLLKAEEGSFDAGHPTESIDASILSANLISPILGIDDLRTDKRIDFVGGIRGTEELVRLVDSDKYEVAFSLYATTINQLLAVADAGEVMPPKSTWFEPKLRTGLVVNLLKE
jgi:uncharacterized protein (DUF1015 family)